MISRKFLQALSMTCKVSRRTMTQTAAVTETIQFREKLRKVGIVGIPSTLGQGQKGVDEGPKVLREAELIQKLRDLGLDVHDYGDIPLEIIDNDVPVFNLKYPKTHAVNSMKISKKVSSILRDGRLCLTLGGDHSLALGSIHGHASVHPNLSVIWIDAHADINTPLTSHSGNFHGMPLSFLLHELQEYVPAIPEFDSLQSCISVKNIVYIGLRDIDHAERIFLHEFDIKHYTMRDIDEKGIVRVLNSALNYLTPGPENPIHVSVDIDSLDPIYANSTGTPVIAGLTLREVLYIMEELYTTGALSMVDMVEVNPRLQADTANSTVAAAVSILLKALGDHRRVIMPTHSRIPKPDDFGVLSRRPDQYVEYDS